MRRYAALVLLSGLGYVIALATQIAISHRFGATAELDAYWAALALLNFLAFYAGPIREAAVPEYHRLLGQEGNDKDKYLSRVGALLLVPSLLGALAALTFSGPLAALVASDEAQAVQTAELLRMLAPGVALFAAGELLAGLLVPFHRIVAQAAVRLLGAGTMLGCVLLLAGHWGARGIAAGFLAMQLVAVVAQGALLVRAGARLASPRGVALGQGPRAVLKALLITYLFSHGYAVLEKEVFMTLRPGLASGYQYAIALVNTLLSIFGASLTALLWPRLMDAVRDRARDTTLALTGLGLQAVLLILAPLCTFLFLMAEPVVLLIYGRGAFDAQAAGLTSAALRAAVFGAIPVAVASVLIRLMVSTQAASGLARVGIGIALSGALVLLAARASGSETLGMLHWPLANLVGMAAALGAFAGSFSLPRAALGAALRWSVRLALACLAMGALLAFWPAVREGVLLRALDLTLAFAAAMTLYGAVVWALRLLPPRLARPLSFR
jgi:putative peptidoglycan lipid II flippase